MKVPADEAECGARTKEALPDGRWASAGVSCRPRCAPAAGRVEGVQGRGLAALGRLGGATRPAGTAWEGEEEEEGDSRAREAGWAGAGRESAALLDSRWESEGDPVTQRRLQFSY